MTRRLVTAISVTHQWNPFLDQENDRNEREGVCRIAPQSRQEPRFAEPVSMPCLLRDRYWGMSEPIADIADRCSPPKLDSQILDDPSVRGPSPLYALYR
jgi:hypothetical protein